MPEKLPSAVTTSYSVQFCHAHEEGISINPVAGPDPQLASIVRLHAPMELLAVYWAAVKEGAPPTLPSYRSFNGVNGNRLFVRGERCGIVCPNITGHIWCAAGYFIYAVPSCEDLDSIFSLSKCPWEGTATDNARDFYIPAQNFVGSPQNPVGRIFNPYSFPANGIIDTDVPRLQFEQDIN